MPDKLTTDNVYGYDSNDSEALPSAQAELIEKRAAPARQAELQAELDAFTEAYFATDEWELDFDDPCDDGFVHSQNDWLREVEGVLKAQLPELL